MRFLSVISGIIKVEVSVIRRADKRQTHRRKEAELILLLEIMHCARKLQISHHLLADN